MVLSATFSTFVAVSCIDGGNQSKVLKHVTYMPLAHYTLDFRNVFYMGVIVLAGRYFRLPVF